MYKEKNENNYNAKHSRFEEYSKRNNWSNKENVQNYEFWHVNKFYVISVIKPYDRYYYCPYLVKVKGFNKTDIIALRLPKNKINEYGAENIDSLIEEKLGMASFFNDDNFTVKMIIPRRVIGLSYPINLYELKDPDEK